VAARELSTARDDMSSFGKLVEEVRGTESAPCFTGEEVDLIEDEYARKAEIEKNTVEIFRSCMESASANVGEMTQSLGTRSRIVERHRDTLRRHPSILAAMDRETERFASLLRSLEELLQSTAK